MIPRHFAVSGEAMLAGVSGRVQSLLARLASLRLTLLGLALLALATLALYLLEQGATPWLAAPLLLLGVNLSAAIATHATLRRPGPLLLFHLALVALVLVAAAGRLTYLNGRAEVTEGGGFSGLMEADAGPLHRGRLASVSFINEGFDISYKPGPVRDLTRNRVRWLDESGAEQVREIGDNDPLIVFGYRFYPSFNKGYAPLLLWQPRGGTPLLGALHLPSYPANALRQSREWRPTGGATGIWLMLQFDETIVAADQPSQFRLPGKHVLVVRSGERRWELQPGGRAELADGVLVYHGLRTWMGYKVFYDWTLPWLLGISLVAVASLAWHFWRKFVARPWNA